MDIPTSLSLPQIRGTTFRLHLLTVLTVGWYGLVHASGETDALLHLGGLLGALIIHELGHWVAARFYRVRVEQSVIFPFGGVALLRGVDGGRGELFYRLGGSLANLLALLLIAAFHDPFATAAPWSEAAFEELSYFNTMVGGINLLPLPPLDGGAYLLSAARRRGRPTIWSGRGRLVTIGAGILLIILGVIAAEPIALAAGIAVGVNALHRAARERTGEILGNTTVEAAMSSLNAFPSLAHGATVRGSIEEVVRSPNTVFVARHNEAPLGVVFRSDIIDAAIDGSDRYIAELIARDLSPIAAETLLEEVLDRVKNTASDPLLVTRAGELCGILFPEQLFEFMVVRHACGGLTAPPAHDETHHE